VGQRDGGREPGGDFLIFQSVREKEWRGRRFVPDGFRDPVRREAPETLKNGLAGQRVRWEVSGFRRRVS
jgi:hypothetical protein